jgi:hypothetical protein
VVTHRYAADRLLNDALAAVDLAFVRRDDHCSESPGSAGCADWLHEVDYEPTPAPVDRWARGAVPTIAKQTVRNPHHPAWSGQGPDVALVERRMATCQSCPRPDPQTPSAESATPGDDQGLASNEYTTRLVQRVNPPVGRVAVF